jgi:ribosome maturation protein SDO1
MGISVDKAVIARIERKGEKFEILVDPEKAVEFRSGKTIPMDELLAVGEIFEDAKKGLRVAKEKLNKMFGTGDINKIAELILKEGEIQITTEQRRKMLEEKKRKIASIIARESINPQTNTPHPIERILNAMEQAKVMVDLYKSAEQQVESVVEAIQRILPIKFEKVNVEIRIPSQYAGKCVSLVRGFGVVKKEEWKGDGSYLCVIEIPAGMQNELYDKLNSITHGEAIVNVRR